MIDFQSTHKYNHMHCSAEGLALQCLSLIYVPSESLACEPRPQATPRFYLAAVDFSPQRRDKIWEWPGDEATRLPTCILYLYILVVVCTFPARTRRTRTLSQNSSKPSCTVITSLIPRTHPLMRRNGVVKTKSNSRKIWDLGRSRCSWCNLKGKIMPRTFIYLFIWVGGGGIESCMLQFRFQW